jgi:peroxiredoxin
MKVRPGDVVRIRELHTVEDKPIPVPDPERLTHLQFRRFAGCPICNVHLQSMVANHGQIVAAGIHQVVLFHSTPAEVRTYARDLPFDVVADPDKQLYEEFGVETSLRASSPTQRSGTPPPDHHRSPKGPTLPKQQRHRRPTRCARPADGSRWGTTDGDRATFQASCVLSGTVRACEMGAAKEAFVVRFVGGRAA